MMGGWFFMSAEVIQHEFGIDLLNSLFVFELRRQKSGAWPFWQGSDEKTV